VRGEIVGQIDYRVGLEGARAVQSLLEGASQRRAGYIYRDDCRERHAGAGGDGSVFSSPHIAAAGSIRGGGHEQRVLPKLSQETLAEMVGTTRSRVNFFMNKFRKLGLIEYNGGLKVNSSLLSVVLHD
jgi:hypothetical protein